MAFGGATSASEADRLAGRQMWPGRQMGQTAPVLLPFCARPRALADAGLKVKLSNLKLEDSVVLLWVNVSFWRPVLGIEPLVSPGHCAPKDVVSYLCQHLSSRCGCGLPQESEPGDDHHEHHKNNCQLLWLHQGCQERRAAISTVSFAKCLSTLSFTTQLQ